MAGRKVAGASVNFYLIVLGFAVSMDFTVGSKKRQDTEFTFILPAGRTECFYQTAMQNGSLEVEYQVIAGARLDIAFALINPKGFRVVSYFRRTEGIDTVEPTEEGDYAMCFDNSFSTMSDKMVYFGVIVAEAGEGAHADGGWVEEPPTETETAMEYKLEDIRASMDAVRKHLGRSRQIQAMLRMYVSRDRYLLEDNLWKVSFWSCVNVLVVVTVAVSQVYTLRRLFTDDKKIRT